MLRRILYVYFFFCRGDEAMPYYFYYYCHHLRFSTRRLDILIINNSFIPFGMPSSYNIARPPPVINIDKNPCYLLILPR